jgi:hypothetical protein
MFIEEMQNRREYRPQYNQKTGKVEVHEHRVVAGKAVHVGVVFIGSEGDSNQFIGKQVGGFTLVSGKLIETKITPMYEETAQQRMYKQIREGKI